jgi:hypothetical protein
MFLIASNTFWPSLRTPSATSSEIEVAFLSRRTRTTVPSRIRRMIGSSLSERAFQASQSPLVLRHTRLTVSLPTAPRIYGIGSVGCTAPTQLELFEKLLDPVARSIQTGTEQIASLRLLLGRMFASRFDKGGLVRGICRSLIVRKPESSMKQRTCRDNPETISVVRG